MEEDAVLQEFYVQATRSSGARVPPEVAVRLITSWNRFPVQQPASGLGMTLTATNLDQPLGASVADRLARHNLVSLQNPAARPTEMMVDWMTNR
jgi:hypothetical protein